MKDAGILEVVTPADMIASMPAVPQQLKTVHTMRYLMGDFAREVARDSGEFRENASVNPGEYFEYAKRGRAFDEYRKGYGGNVEYLVRGIPARARRGGPDEPRPVQENGLNYLLRV